MMYDVTVIGSGPAGSITALTLAQLGRKVLLVDRAPQSPFRKIGESLPGGARAIFRQLGILAIVDNGPHQLSYGNEIVWGSDRITSTDFISDPNGPGWHLDRQAFDEDLKRAAIKAGATWKIAEASEMAFTTSPWVVDATGRNSYIARSRGAVRTADDDLMAAYVWTNPKENDKDTRTLVEATSQGWWYTSLLPAGKRIVAFHTDAKSLAPLLRSRSAWESSLEETLHVKQKVERSEPLSPQSIQAWGGRLDEFTGDGWLAVGDAALSFDPLSSQGIFNALYTGMKAGEALHSALSGNSKSILEYRDRLESIRSSYLENRRQIYKSESRFSTSVFWKQRA